MNTAIAEIVSLDDKYALAAGYAFMSGVHALVRLPMMQKVRDARAGRNTAGFISGYRGSPLGKRSLIEQQLKDELYHCAPHARPRISGKYEAGADPASGTPTEWLLRPNADLTPAIIAKAIARRLKGLDIPADIRARMDARIAIITARESALATVDPRDGERKPWFCPGCPHNTSTRVPEGSLASAGMPAPRP